MATEKTVPVYDNSFLRLMAKAGISFGDARWFHLKMVGDGFNTDADLRKVKYILNQMKPAVPGVVCA